MAEPLNIFLEDIEVLVRQCGDDDAELGKRVRDAWTTLIEAEKPVNEVTNQYGVRMRFPATMPEWPNGR